MVFENFRINIPRRGYRVQVGEGGITCSLTSHPRTPVRVHLPTSVSHESGPLLEILGSPFLQGGGDQRQLPLLRATGGSGSRRPRAESGENRRENHPLPLDPSFFPRSILANLPGWNEAVRVGHGSVLGRGQRAMTGGTLRPSSVSKARRIHGRCTVRPVAHHSSMNIVLGIERI